MNPIYQEQVISFLETYPNGNVMIPVYGHTEQFGVDTFFQCIIAPVEFAEEDMKRDDINRWPTSLIPGFTQYGVGDNADIIYSRYNNSENIEPFVIIRDYEGTSIKNQVEIVEEFRLLNNIYFDASKNEYRDVETDTIVVKIIGTGLVTVHKRYLKRYLSVKTAVMLVHVDSRYSQPTNDGSISSVHKSCDLGDKVCSFTISASSGLSGQQPFSLLYSKILIEGIPVQDCGYWPYDNIDRQYEDFMIGLDCDGNEKSYNSNPERLNNLFGAKPDAPLYLTPVYFSRDVLKKYYDKPVRYTVEDGILRCGTKWALYIDNQHDDYVSAYLGDLGRNLPDYQEQQYWRRYNIVVDGSLSNAKWKRDFESQFAAPDSPIFLFQNEYRAVNDDFKKELGWPLFLPFHGDDEYNFTGLRLPLSNEQPEFDSLVLGLVKVLIDSINEEQIKIKIPEGITGSISRLEKWLELSSVVDYQGQLKFLRNLQKLRSCSVGHRKGSGYEKIMNDLAIDSNNLKEGYKSLVIKATEFLSFLRLNLRKLV